MNQNEILNDKENYHIFAVSGGPDSMFMLDVFHKSHPDMKIIVAHVNYNFREDSGVDQKLVENYCKKEKIKFRVRNIDPKIYSSLKWNFEEYARNVRYDFFEELAEKYKANVIFIAHNENDLIETYLLQKERKSLVNYYGLRTLTSRNNLWIYRPLLAFKKSEILTSNTLNQVPFALDSTNIDKKYRRNNLRTTLNEFEFPLYLHEISKLNEELEKTQIVSKKYIENNFHRGYLLIDKRFYKFDEKIKKQIMIYFLEAIGQGSLLLKRKKNTLQEMVKLTENKNKPFLTLTLGETVFVKDFDKIYFVKNNFFKTFDRMLNTDEDLEKIHPKALKLEVQNWIASDNQNYPYRLSNDYENYKQQTFVKDKKTNRYFINKKISHRVRAEVPALIRINDNQIVNIKVFSKYEIIN